MGVGFTAGKVQLSLALLDSRAPIQEIVVNACREETSGRIELDLVRGRDFVTVMGSDA